MILRRESIDTETGNTIAGEGAETSALSSATVLAEARKIASVSRIQDVIARALTGGLPRDRELKAWEPAKLRASHINMVLDKAAGYNNREIAERNEYDEARVCIVLAHPDAQFLLSTILAGASDKLMDVTDRLQHLAPEALNVKLDILRNQNNSAAIRDRVATDLLDRAGYGARKQIDVNAKHAHSISMPAQVATGLAAALDESNRVALVDYRQHLRRPQDDEVAQAADLQLSSGQTEPVAGPLHSESDCESAKERVA